MAPTATIVPDLKERLPGRGVWVTADHAVVAEAAKRNVFARALKAASQGAAGLAAQVDRLLVEAALGALALANKAGEVVFGTAKIEEAIAKAKVAASASMRATPQRTAAASSTADFGPSQGARRRPRSAFSARMNWVWHQVRQM